MSNAARISSRGISPGSALAILSGGLLFDGDESVGGMTFFDSRLGIDQGRLQSTGVAPAQGDYAMVLGSDQEGHLVELEAGDYVEAEQVIDVTGAKLLRADLTLRDPGDLPAGQAWQVSILVDSVKVASTLGWSGRTREITDLAANVSQLDGEHTIAVRLELVET